LTDWRVLSHGMGRVQAHALLGRLKVVAALTAGAGGPRPRPLSAGLAEPAAPVADPVQELRRGDDPEIRAHRAQGHDRPVQ
jgi:hypothetical protein